VVLENFRPDTMEKLGFGWAALQEDQPARHLLLICGSGTTPFRERQPPGLRHGGPGVQQVSEHPPARGRPSLPRRLLRRRHHRGCRPRSAILAALRHRERSGRGQYVDIAMVTSLFSVLENASHAT